MTTAKTLQTYLKEAKNPQTLSARLTKLAFSVPQIKNATVERSRIIMAFRCAVARNPNASEDTLRMLVMGGYLRDVRANANLPMLALEKPADWFFWARGLEDSFSEEAMAEAWRKKPKATNGVKISKKDLTSMRLLLERMVALCIFYRIPVHSLIVESRPAIGARQRLEARDPTQITLQAAWRGYSRAPLSIERVNRFLDPDMCRLGVPADLSARITVTNVTTGGNVKGRLEHMLRAEGYYDERPRRTMLRRVGAGLQVFESPTCNMTKTKPVLFFRLKDPSSTTSEADVNLFQGFTPWYSF